jgi:hypothetical protein
MDAGIKAAAGTPIVTPLPGSWLGRASVPPTPPGWANIGVLLPIQLRNLQAQIAYDLSMWNYNLVGNSNKLGRYQVSTAILEAYGLLANGSNTAYGTDCVNYVHSWQPTMINNGINAYQNYFYNVSSLTNFLSNTIAQEHLAYQRLADIYLNAKDIGVIKSEDAPDIIAGMMYVAWTLGVGAGPTISYPNGTGAWAWRYNNVGAGANNFNSGRYSIAVLSS